MMVMSHFKFFHFPSTGIATARTIEDSYFFIEMQSYFSNGAVITNFATWCLNEK